jgi:phage portal protein BeeE
MNPKDRRVRSLRAARQVRGGPPRLTPMSASRAAAPYGTSDGARRIEMMQTYGAPSSEMPLNTFAEYARGAYGANGYPGNSTVFACISRRMNVFSEATFKYRNLTDKRLFGDQSLALLEQPWPDGSTGDLLKRMEQDASLAGNAYVRLAGDRLERLQPGYVTLVSRVEDDGQGGQVRVLIGVAYDPTDDQDRDADFYPISEVAHWAPIPDPLANFRGMSWLTPVVREIQGDVRMSQYREAFFTNAATPNLVIMYEQKIAPERVARLKNAIQARHTGPDGAFGTLVLDEGADLQVVGADMAGSAFDALQAAGETRIAAASGVPAIVAGLREGLQASQIGEYQQALRAFADINMRPNWRDVCSALSKLVPVPSGSQLWFDVTDVSALQQGEKDAADTSFQQVQSITALTMQGFTPESSVRAVVAGDMSLLQHTGAQSVQVQPGTGATTTPKLPVSVQINGSAHALPAAA